MASSLSLEDLLSAVPPAVLDRPCLDDHLVDLALKLTNWKEVGYFLKLKETEFEEVEAGVGAELVRTKSLRMLRKWRAKYGEHATYRCLCKTLWKLDKVSTIEEVIGLLLAPPDADPTSVLAVLPKESGNGISANYVSYLKFRYSTNMPSCVIQSPQPPTDMYFELSLIERQKREEALLDIELANLAVEGKVTQMMEKRTPVKLEDIFKLDTKRRKIILIEGAPGSGKTTLSWHICQKWETEELFTEFCLVIYVQLRDPAIQSAKSFADLLPRRDDQMAQDIYTELKTTDGEGVLFVLDGWDELPGDLPRDSPLRQLIEPTVCPPLQRSAVIITSRPEASGDLRSLASSRIQIVGFTPEKVEEYFAESLKGDPEAVKTLVEHVREQPAIAGVCSLPLNVAIVVTLFLHMGHQLPTTLTGLFVALVLHCILRHSKSRTDLRVRSLSSFDALPDELQKPFDHLCALAYQGVLNDQILFTEDEVGFLSGFAMLSLLQVVESFVAIGSARNYHFLHLSIQELLAAWHIARMPLDAQANVHKLLQSEQFSGVFRFFAGFTSLRLPQSREAVKATIVDCELQMDSLLQCLHEAQDMDLYRFVADHLQQIEIIFMRKLSPVACHSLGYLLPLVSPTTVILYNLDEQGTILLSKGLQKGWIDHQKHRGELTVKLTRIDALCSHNGIQAVVRLLSVCGIRNLSLRLCVNPPITWQDVLKSVTKELTHNSSVRHFCLGGYPTETNYLKAGIELCEALKYNRTLESLNLDFWLCPVDIDVRSIARGLMVNTTLQNLEIRKRLFMDDEVKALAEMLAVNRKLLHLRLSKGKVTDKHTHLLAETLAGSVSLTSLDLSHNCITDIGAVHLANMLRTNTSLEHLNLVHNSRISSKGVAHLAEALKHNSTLKLLNLDHRMLSEGFEPLALALTVNRTVNIIDPVYGLYPTPPSGLAEKLLAGGVLKQLLTVALEKFIDVVGGEQTFVALIALLEELMVISD